MKNYPAKSQSGKNKTLDAIRHHYYSGGRSPLTDHQSELKERLAKAFTLLTKHSLDEAKSILMTEFNLTRTTAGSDIRNAIDLYGDVQKVNKEGLRWILWEQSMQVYQLAATRENIREMNKAIANRIKIFALDKEDPDVPDFGKLQPNVYPIVLDEGTMKALQTLIAGNGSIDLATISEKIAAQADEAEIDTT